MDIDVSSSPPGLSETEALALVFRQADLEAVLRGLPFSETVQRQLAEVLLGAAIPGILEGVEIGGITFAIEPGLDVPLQLSASALLTERLSVAYSRSAIGRIPFDTLSLSYLLTPRTAATITFEEKNEVLYLLEGSTRF